MIRLLSVLAFVFPIAAHAAESIRVGQRMNRDTVLDFQVYASGRGCVHFGNIQVGPNFPNVIYNGRVERVTTFRFFHAHEGFNSVSTLSPSVEVPFDAGSWSIPPFKICGLTPGQRVFTSGGFTNQIGTIIYFMPLEKSNQGAHSVLVR